MRMKKIFYNLKSTNSKLIWCIVSLFIMLSFAMKVNCSDGVKKSIITLPKAENGIEKIEYTVNGEAKGSTDGINSIELEPGSKVNFAIKFQSEGYNKLHVRNVKITSENGSVLRLNTYGRDDDGNFILMRVKDSELINPEQTYVSSDYTVGKNDRLSFEGIDEDRYLVRIADENDDVNLSDAVKLKYSENGDNYISAEFSESENAFLIDGLTQSSNVKLQFEINDGYTKSNLSLVNGERQIAINEPSKVCTLPELKGDTKLEIRNLEKNSYNVNFSEYTNAKFFCKIAGSNDEFKSVDKMKVHYGDNLEIKCETSDDSILESGKITANGKVIASKDNIYTLENIKDDYSIAVTPNASAIYTISLPRNEDRIKLCDTFLNEVSEIDVKQNESVNFKIVPVDAYKQNFIVSEMYAVPESKLSDGNYDLEANSEESKPFLVVPSGNYTYTLQNINEPVKIIAKNMQKSVYTVTLPDNIIGASAEVETNEDVTKLTENKFRVVHGSDFVVNLESQPGYDLSEINVGDVNNSLEIKKEDNKYTFKNIDSDKYLIINGATTASCNVSFDTNDIIATNENGSKWKNNTTSIKYQEGTLKFKVSPVNGTGDLNEDIPLNIKSGKGTLEKISSEKNTYSLSNVTDDITLIADRKESSDVTIQLKSDNDDVQFTDANDENIILPEKNTVKYGTDLNFKLVSKSGKSMDNLSVSSTTSNPVTESDTSSNTYSVTALRSGTMLTNTRNTAKSGHYVDLCNNLYAPQTSGSTNGPLYQNSSVALPKRGGFYGDNNFDEEIPRILVFSKDPEACECLNKTTELELSQTVGGSDRHYDIMTTNYEKSEDDDSFYTLPLNLPELSNIGNQNFSLFFNFNTADNVNVNVNFFQEILTGDDGITRCLPNVDEALPEPTLSEISEGDYNQVIEPVGYAPGGSSALQYLENCYCFSFSKLYSEVKINNNLNSQPTDITIKDTENIQIDTNDTTEPKDLIVTTYSPELNNNRASFDYKPVTSKFKIYIDNDKKFKDSINEPLALNSGAHAKLTQEIGQDDVSKCYYVDCTLVTTAFDESIDLNWSSNSVITDKTNDVRFNITFNPYGGIFRNSQGTETNADTVVENGKLVFYTEPQTGYAYEDTLSITRNQTPYNVDNISKIAIDGDKTNYNGEWIAFDLPSDTNPNTTPIFIRAVKSGSRVKYEIAGDGEQISEYITRDTAQPGDSDVVKYTKTTKQEGQHITALGVTADLSIKSVREKRKLSVTFSYAEGIQYTNESGTAMPEEPTELNYGEALAFKVVAENGYDVSNIQVTASTAGNTNILPLTNGMYVIINITENTTISVSGVEKSNVSLTFEQYEGLKYKNTSGAEYPVKQQIPYGEEVIFQIEVDEGYSGSSGNVVVKVNGDTFDNTTDHTKPYKVDNLYIIPGNYATKDMKITVSGLEVNKYTVSLKPTSGIKYYDVSGENTLPENNSGINYGNSFKFRIMANEGYDTSNIEVVAKKNSGGSNVTLIPANGIYTVDNITSDYTITVSGVSKQQHTVEFRTVTGVACIDSYGKTLPSSVTVSDGDSYSFYLSFDPAYSKSKDTADVTIKGTNNKVPHDSNGKYTLSNIRENKIVEIINVRKNSYTATFVPAEGVIYRTAKGKEFSGTQNVEYGESLYFKISLMDAYDQSFPAVKMNGTKTLVENSGSYVLENISDDVVITVENVGKNPEEVTIDHIQNVPDPVTNEDDVNAVVAATKAYNSLSDEEKKLVTNKQALEKAQGEAGDINHNSNGVTISGVDWNVKLIVTPLSDNKEEMEAFAQEVDRRSLLSLYRAELIDLLTGESYSIPYGSEVQITLPCPDLTGYKNVTIAHRNLADNMEYLDPNIVGGTAKFSATSVGLFGIAAKEIPNYSEGTSGMSISMGNLVSDDDELKTLLGEDLSSQLGHLIDLEDENGENKDSSKNNGKGDNNGVEGNSDSLLNNMANGAASLASSLYNWAIDNELLAVLAVLLLGSLLIFLILLANRKKNKEEEKDNLRKEK